MQISNPVSILAPLQEQPPWADTHTAHPSVHLWWQIYWVIFFSPWLIHWSMWCCIFGKILGVCMWLLLLCWQSYVFEGNGPGFIPHGAKFIKASIDSSNVLHNILTISKCIFSQQATVMLWVYNIFVGIQGSLVEQLKVWDLHAPYCMSCILKSNYDYILWIININIHVAVNCPKLLYCKEQNYVHCNLDTPWP